MVEAGRVDHAHHGTNAYRAMRDMQALNEAVKTAKDKTGDDTLIIGSTPPAPAASAYAASWSKTKSTAS